MHTRYFKSVILTTMVVAVLAVLLLTSIVIITNNGLLVGTEQAEASGDVVPGSVGDPLLTGVSLQHYLEALFASPHQELDQLQGRFDRIAVDIAAIKVQIWSGFPDLQGYWAENEINFLHGRGIISGYPDGKFHPTDGLSRGALAVMLVKARNLPAATGSATFSDLPRSHWAAAAVGAAVQAGYLRGYPGGRVAPDGLVTRAEVAVVLDKAFKPQPKKVTHSFPDLAGHWARTQIEQLVADGIIGGYQDDTFKPDQPMSRAEVAVALARCLL